ncbi:thiamine pyrophosphate-dependent enzyme [Candidatus Leptofilum sp.]|uniref:thiamine pyrophosphate-dependent enzyme n=1 Tax=Candidatus Leptofilum sp. TaxID=3241576 RepID=UPI003B59D4AD
MTQLTGGEAAVKTLIAHNIHTLFGLPGVQNDWLYNALYDAQDQIRVIHTRHEQGAGYMALGYALAKGEISVFNVVPGPGLLNASAALATAYGLNAPVLCLTGQIPSNQIGLGKGVLHEIPDQLAILRGLTKWAERASSVADVSGIMYAAFAELQNGLPRPVAVEIPMDVLAERGAVELAARPAPVTHPQPDLELVEKAAKALGEAKRPLIFVGSGAQNASTEVRQLATMLEAPVVGYRTGQGIMDGRHYLSLHLPPAHELWKTTDAVLLIGTHGRIPIKSWGVDDEMTLIKIDIDPTTHDLFHPPHIPITARAEETLPLLLERTAAHNQKRTSRKDELLAIKAAWEQRTAYLEPQKSYLKVIREALGEDGIFVDELTQVGFASRIVYPVYQPRTYISTGYMGTLGYGFPAALGVKVAKPDLPVISVAGDGGFMFGVQELATAMQHRIGLITIIFNNNQYGNVQQMQKNLYGNRVIASNLHNPDFVKLAESFGAQGLRAKSPQELRRAIQQGLQTDLPTVIEVPVGDMPSVDRFRKLPKVR